MNVLEIPFSKFLGLQKADPDSDYILKMEEKEECQNHLKTMHAGALFVLAETASGQFLIEEFKEFESQVIPVVRKAEVKYSIPGKGSVFSKAELFETSNYDVVQLLNTKGRAIVKVKVDIFDVDDKKIMTSVFDWIFTVNKK